MTMKDKSFVEILLLIIFVAIVNSYILLSVPVFADGATYASLILDTMNNDHLVQESSILPNFLLIGSALTQFTQNVEISLALLNIIPILLLIALMYSIISRQFNKQVGLYTAVFLSFTPMFLWVISHRLIDPLTYFIPVLCIWLYLRFAKDSSPKKWILTALFLLMMVGLKLTLLPFAIGFLLVEIHSFLKGNREQRIKVIRGMGIIAIISLLFIPYLQYCYPTYVEHVNPEEDWVDQYLQSVLSREELEVVEQIQAQFIVKQGTLPYITDYLVEGNLIGVLQYFSILPVYEYAKNQWFSPIAGSLWIIFLVVFILGIFYWVKDDFFRNGYSRFLVVSSIVIIPFMLYYAIMRYLFYMSIMTSFLFGLGFYYVLKKARSIKYSNKVLSGFVIVCLFLIIASEASEIMAYRYSYGHNRLQEGGVLELHEVGRDFPRIVGATIFTPASDPAYYLDAKTLWEWRIFFVDSEEDILLYLENFNITYLIVPKYSLTPTVWNGSGLVPNDIEHFGNSKSIPLDSVFYSMMNNELYYHNKTYSSFIVYELQVNSS